MSTEPTERLTHGGRDRSSHIALGRRARVLGASVMAAPLVYGLSAWLMNILPQDSQSEAMEVVIVRIVFVCMFMQLVAFMVPCAALALLAVAAVYTWRSHVALVPATALVLAGAMFSVGSWLNGLYGFDPPYVLFFLGSAMQLVAMATPVLALGWVIVRLTRRAVQERRA